MPEGGTNGVGTLCPEDAVIAALLLVATVAKSGIADRRFSKLQTLCSKSWSDFGWEAHNGHNIRMHVLEHLKFDRYKHNSSGASGSLQTQCIPFSHVYDSRDI